MRSENAKLLAEECRRQISEGIGLGEIRKQEKVTKQHARQNQLRLKEGLPTLNSYANISLQWLESIAHLTGATKHIRNPVELNFVKKMEGTRD